MIAMSHLAFCEQKVGSEQKFGSLNIFSEGGEIKIFVDEEYVGMNNVKIKNIQTGSHLVKATQDNEVIFQQVVDVGEGELVTILIPKHKKDKDKDKDKEKEPPTQPPAQPSTPIRQYHQMHPRYIMQDNIIIGYGQPMRDYSREMNSGWFIKTSYITNMYLSTQSTALDRYGSSLGLGIGMQMSIAPQIDFMFMIERGEFIRGTVNWFFMPITGNLQFSYLPSPYFGGKQYYGIGLGYYMTNLKSALSEELNSMGYHIYYGLEMPSGDVGAFYFEFGYQSADISRSGYILANEYISMGYRFFGD